MTLSIRLRPPLIIIVLVALLVAGLLWWPQSVRGRIVNGVSGEPIAGVQVSTTGIIYKPLAPLHALAWGNATTSATRVVTTDRDGRFDATFLAGVRLRAALLYMTKRGFVVAPGIEGGSGAANLHAEDFSSRPTFSAWPVSSSTDMETGGAIGRASGDGRERQVQFGHAHALWFRAQAHNRSSDEDPIPVSIRWVSARLQETQTFALTAPVDGYERIWEGTLDCARREPTPRFFSVQFDGNSFGAVSIDMQSLCFGGGDVRISYRFAEDAGVRSLADESELRLAAGHRF